MTRRVYILLMTVAIGVRAQDLRHVAEPVFPPVCTSLTAGNSWPVHEDRADTPRIQAALDGCGAGRAVELKSTGTEDSFLSGPLFLRKGVTLMVTSGTTLYASRNPRD